METKPTIREMVNSSPTSTEFIKKLKKNGMIEFSNVVRTFGFKGLREFYKNTRKNPNELLGEKWEGLV